MSEKPDVIFGRYRIIEEIDRGGMGIVYKAEDITLERFAALKKLILNPILDEGEKKKQIDRFVLEAKAIARFSHPNIVAVYDAGTFEGDYYIAMEYVQGKTLDYYMDKGNRFPLSQVVNIGIQALEALNEAHNHKIIHRDIKPNNIMLLNSGKIKIMDFGIARALDKGTMTSAGSVLGTIGYMSPEQWGNSRVDGRSDIFSLSVILYQMMAGDRPFPSDSIATFVANLLSDDFQPEPLRKRNNTIPESMERIIMKGLEREKERRYQNAEQMLVDLQAIQNRILADEGMISHPVPDAISIPHSDIIPPSGSSNQVSAVFDDPRYLPEMTIDTEIEKKKNYMDIIIIILLIIIGIIGITGVFTWSRRASSSDSSPAATSSKVSQQNKSIDGKLIIRTRLEGVLVKLYRANGKLFRQFTGDELIIENLKRTSKNRTPAKSNDEVIIDVPSGIYSIKLIKDNYYEISKNMVEIRIGEQLVIDDHWIKKPSITVTTNVPETGVWLNNEYKGDTGKKGLKISGLDPGKYFVKLRKSGYGEKQREVEIGELTQAKLDFDLIPIDGIASGKESSPAASVPSVKIPEKPAYPVKVPTINPTRTPKEPTPVKTVIIIQSPAPPEDRPFDPLHLGPGYRHPPPRKENIEGMPPSEKGQ